MSHHLRLTDAHYLDHRLNSKNFWNCKGFRISGCVSAPYLAEIWKPPAPWLETQTRCFRCPWYAVFVHLVHTARLKHKNSTRQPGPNHDIIAATHTAFWKPKCSSATAELEISNSISSWCGGCQTWNPIQEFKFWVFRFLRLTRTLVPSFEIQKPDTAGGYLIVCGQEFNHDQHQRCLWLPGKRLRLHVTVHMSPSPWRASGSSPGPPPAGPANHGPGFQVTGKFVWLGIFFEKLSGNENSDSDYGSVKPM